MVQASCGLLFLAIVLGILLPIVTAATCTDRTINETVICQNVNSTGLIAQLPVIVPGNLSRYACASGLSALSSSNILTLLTTNSGVTIGTNLEQLILFFSKVNGTALENALESFNNQTANTSVVPLKDLFLMALWETKLRNASQYSQREFVEAWFQARLRPFLSAIPTSVLQCLQNVSMGCQAYQAIVKGLNVEFDLMAPETRSSVYSNLVFPYLQTINSTKSPGLVCIDNLNSSSSWLMTNFEKFRMFATYKDLASLNTNFNGLDVLNLLTTTQMADATVESGALNSVEKITNIYDNLQNRTYMELKEYYTRLNSRNQSSINETVQILILNRTLELLFPQLTNFTTLDYADWFQNKLLILLPSLTSAQLTQIISDVSCGSYQSVVKGLDAAYPRMSNTTSLEIYEALKVYLTNHTSGGVACGTSGSNVANENSDWLQKNLGRFRTKAKYADFLLLKTNFSGFDTLELLTPTQLADLTVDSGAIQSSTNITAIFDIMKNRSLYELTVYYTRFNSRNVPAQNLTAAATMLNKTLEVLFPQLTNFTTLDYADWFQNKLHILLPSLTSAQLTQIFTNMSCDSYQAVVKGLDATHSRMTDETRRGIYGALSGYLINHAIDGASSIPPCYNASDSAWFAMNLGPFIQYSSVADIRAMVSNDSILQTLTTNTKNLDLVNNTEVPDDVAELYASALFAKDPNFNFSSLPDKLLCFAKDSAAIKNKKPDELLDIIKTINAKCGPSSSSTESASHLQLAALLVGQFPSLNSNTLKALGQQAVGMSTGQIAKMSSADVLNSVGELGKVRGWDAGQAQGLVGKLLASNISFANQDSFLQLGSLVTGLPSAVFDEMPNEVAINLTKNADFVFNLASAPVYVQQAFVGKVCSKSSSSTDCVHNVPDTLAGAIPNSQLIFGNIVPDIKILSKKQWTKDQAVTFFGNLVQSNTSNFTDFSASVLQGSQCHSISKLSPNNFASLVSQMKCTQTSLDASQLTCLARLSRQNSLDHNLLPADALLFYDTDNVKGNCKDFFTQASRGNVNNLAQNPAQVKKLLKTSSSCLNIKGSALNADQLRSLGGLVCYMNPSVIGASDPQIVENLKQCQNLNDDQQTELVNVLKSGKTQYGSPSSWKLGTLNGLGSLPFFMNQDIFSSLKMNIKQDYFKDFVGGFKKQNIQRDIGKKFVDAFTSPVSGQRRKRGAGCTAGNITAASIRDPLFLFTYSTAEEFNRCLDDDVLQQNLAAFADQPLPDDYLQVMKDRLDKIYPQGLPEDQIKLLGGALSRFYTPADINKWNITSSDTLTILMNPNDPPWNKDQTIAILTRYLQSGNPLTGQILKNNGQYLCTLDAAQISNISPDALKDAGTLDISTCTQDKKDILYEKAKEAFSSASNSSSYYSLIQPYLGGAPVADLKSLAQSNVNMDIQTFMGLKPSELQQLSVSDVKNLLGTNVGDLKTYEQDPIVKNWIAQQQQADLDTLGIGLTGGKTTPQSTTITSATSVPAATSAILVAGGVTPVGYMIIPLTSGFVPSSYSLQTVLLTLGISLLRRFL
ncbi:mesothelin [Microcaecilia unicolor]|uniref:Mesothelin n=1 Tax=Microcaecilia unicolor TaxID=1415580 RepID=A0A6P7YSB0_9AMPH|nr:mesothelin [Microcaecilia unicolor]